MTVMSVCEPQFDRLALEPKIALDTKWKLPCGKSIATPDTLYQADIEAVAMTSDFSWDRVEVIYADDDEWFAEVVTAGLQCRGVKTEQVKLATDGLQAMELVLSAQAGEWDKPLLLLLDFRMPNMDGHECAAWAYQLASQGRLRRPPFVIGHSSNVSSKEGKFHAVLPKEAFFPQNASKENGELARYLGQFQQWWKDQHVNDTVRWQGLDISRANCIVVDSEPICRMSMQMALVKCGIHPDRVQEADDAEEAEEIFSDILTRSKAIGELQQVVEPVLVFLGGRVSALPRASQLEPFMVCVSSNNTVTTGSVGDFHCYLPKLFKADDLGWVLQLFKLWWFERDAAAEWRSGTSKARGTPSNPGIAKDLGNSMQKWRERREARKKARAQSAGSKKSYGAECRRQVAADFVCTPNSLMQVLEERWPGKCKCTFQEIIGAGSQATVYRGTWEGSIPTAIKVLKNLPGEEARCQREFEIGQALRSPHLVKTYVGSFDQPLMLIQEYCKGGSVNELLYQDGHPACGVPTLSQRLKIALDVAKGMAALHACDPPIMHRDLKSDNVLLSDPVVDAQCVPVAKVADFGLSRSIKDNKRPLADKFMTVRVGTLRWMAPEIMTGDTGGYGIAADVYSYGVLLFELVTGVLPYGDDPNLANHFNDFVKEGGRPDTATLGYRACAALKASPSWVPVLMRNAWKENPSERPTFPEIVSILVENGCDRSPYARAG
jgi:CheY-like chemotaxis protein